MSTSSAAAAPATIKAGTRDSTPQTPSAAPENATNTQSAASTSAPAPSYVTVGATAPVRPPMMRPIPGDGTAQRPLLMPASQASSQHLQSTSRPQLPGSSHLQPLQQQSHFRGPSQGPRYFQTAATSSQYYTLGGLPSDQYAGYSLPQSRPAGYLRGPSQQYPQSYPQQRPLAGYAQRPPGSAALMMNSSMQSYSLAHPNMRPTSAGMTGPRLPSGAQALNRPMSSGLPAPRPGAAVNSGMLSHNLPQMASKAFAGPASRPLNLGATARGSMQGALRAPLPQMSRQAYLQQASAQLQNFQGGQLYNYPGVTAEGQAVNRPATLAYSYRAMQAPNSTAMRPGSNPPPLARPATYSRPQSGGPTPSAQVGNGGMTHAPPPNMIPRPRSASHCGPAQQHGQITPAADGIHKRPASATSSQNEWPVQNLPLSLANAITVADRKVRLDKEEATTAMYVLLRRWMQNDPTLLTARKEKPLLPRKGWPRVAEDEEQAPKLPCDPNKLRCSSEELLRYNKHHWLRVRRFHVTRRHRRLNQFRHRLATLIPDPSQEQASPSLEKLGEGDVEGHPNPRQRRAESGEENVAGFREHQANEIVKSDMQASEEARQEFYKRHMQLPPQEKQFDEPFQADVEAMVE